jgi:hypothetical protein
MFLVRFIFNLFGDTRMTQKNEKTPVESKVVTETEATSVKPGTKTDVATPQTEQSDLAAKPSKTARGNASTGELSPELIELVTELRDTVKRIDPRKHTEKTLHRVLFNVCDILKDIEALYIQS